MAIPAVTTSASPARWSSSSFCTDRSPLDSPSERPPENAFAGRDALITEHVEWARVIARHVARRLPTWFTDDNLTGPAEIALTEAATKYDPSRGVPVRLFAREPREGKSPGKKQ